MNTYTHTYIIGVAAAAAPFQGVVARVMQEQSIAQSIQNTRNDFRWENRKMTFLRVATRACFTGCTGVAITTAFIIAKKLGQDKLT